MEIKSFIIPSYSITNIKGHVVTLHALLSLASKYNSLSFEVKYDELAKMCGYKNRSGVWKAVKQLEKLGCLKTEGNFIDLHIDVVVTPYV